MGQHTADENPPADVVEDGADALQNQAKTEDERTDAEREADEQNAAKLTSSAEYGNKY